MSEPVYKVGDVVAVQTDEGVASRDVSGRIVEAKAGRFAPRYVIEVLRLYADEEPEYLTVTEDEICGLA